MPAVQRASRGSHASCRWLVAVLIVPLLLAACRGGTDAPRKLIVQGRVVAHGTGVPVAGARVDVVHWSVFLGGTLARLGSAVTGADGAYQLAASPAPGYGAPNCAVMRLDVTASEFQAESISLAFEPQCAGSTPSEMTVNVVLTPVTPPSAARGM